MKELQQFTKEKRQSFLKPINALPQLFFFFDSIRISIEEGNDIEDLFKRHSTKETQTNVVKKHIDVPKF